MAGFNSTNVLCVPKYDFIFRLNNNATLLKLSNDFKVFPEDEIVCCSKFYIESAGRTTDVIKLTKVQAQIVVTDGTDEFELDGFNVDLSSVELTGYTQQFDTQIARAFHIPIGTIRKYIEVKRRNDLDTGTRKYFSLNYPFLFRWESWTKLLGVDSSFFDSTLQNNGFNHWWYHYKTGNFNIKYKLTISATKNGSPQQYEFYNNIVPNDYNSNAAYTTKDITTWNEAETVQYISGGNSHIVAFENTLIKAVFTKTGLVNGYVVIGLDYQTNGGITTKRRYSGKWAVTTDTWLKSIDGSNTVVNTNAANTVTARVLIDKDLIPNDLLSCKITARIYESLGTLTTDDGVNIVTDDGIQITVD